MVMVSNVKRSNNNFGALNHFIFLFFDNLRENELRLIYIALSIDIVTHFKRLLYINNLCVIGSKDEEE